MMVHLKKERFLLGLAYPFPISFLVSQYGFLGVSHFSCVLFLFVLTLELRNPGAQGWSPSLCFLCLSFFASELRSFGVLRCVF